MDKERKLKRLHAIILKMKGRLMELHNYNRIMKFLNSISDDKSFEGALKILCEGFIIDGCGLMVLEKKGLETIAVYGAHSTVHAIAGKGALLFASMILTEGEAQTMATETGFLLSLPIIIDGKSLGVLNLCRVTDAKPAMSTTLRKGDRYSELLNPEDLEFGYSDASFSEIDKRLFQDIACQIGISLDRIISDQARI